MEMSIVLDKLIKDKNGHDKVVTRRYSIRQLDMKKNKKNDELDLLRRELELHRRHNKHYKTAIKTVIEKYETLIKRYKSRMDHNKKIYEEINRICEDCDI